MTAPIAVKALIITFTLSLFCINVDAQLSANFSASPLSGCSPLIANFTDQSTGNPTQWRWDLGNGTISYLKNPSATYFTPGQYTIKLLIHDAAGNADSITKAQYITVNAQPTVNFTGSPLSGCYPLNVQFTDQSIPGSGTISSRLWDFGDGNSSTLQNPVHTYTSAGNFNITLRVGNSVGCLKTLTRTGYVHISQGVHANFSNSMPSSCLPPASVSFQNLSSGTGSLNYQWNFGDGATSTLANPTHIYSITGTYTVRLIVINSTGCRDTLVKNNIINIGMIHAAFTSADSVCVNSTINFTNTSSPVPPSVVWDFGDGSTSTLFSPSKIYLSAGTYNVRLVAIYGACSDTANKSVIVKDKAISGFTATPVSSCQVPLTVSFSNQSMNGINYLWKFGDGNTSLQNNPSHTYTAFGNYSVTLIAINVQGCSDTLVKPAYIQIAPPQVSIDALPLNVCAPLTHTFNATIITTDPVAGYLWDFGDGTTSTASNPTHTFPAGTYIIRLIITTMSGCVDSAVYNPGVIASNKPTANFSASPRDVCAHVPVQFTDLSTGNISSWTWSFGDGGTSNLQNPIHVYEDTGYFTVRLIIYNKGCPDTIQFANYIHINPPIANFNAAFNCGDPRIQTFTDKSIGADTWNWDFGDGTSSTVQNPVHTYASTGIYTVTLLVYNNTTGCSYTKTSIITVVIERANILASDSVICRNSPVNFTSPGTNPGNIASYNWDFGDGSTGTGATPTHTYGLAGRYTVTLIITDIIGCKDTMSKPQYIEVDGPTAAFNVSLPGSCLLSTVSFIDNSTGDGIHPINTWIWNYGDGVIDTLHAPPFQHAYTAPGNYTISLTVTDSKGCSDSYLNSSSINISKPVAAFSTADTISCPGKSINFTDSSTGPNLNYTWEFGDGTSSTAIAPVHIYTADGIYTVKLVVTDLYGCADTLIRPAYIHIASPHAAFAMSDSVGTCPPLFVSFTNNSQAYNTVNWDFGDGTSTQTDNPTHFYSIPGTYWAKLVISSPGGCLDSIEKQIVLRGPQGAFTYGPLSGCKPLAINFTASSRDRISFIWDFNDGNISSTTDSVITHIYTSPGIYIPKMILVDAGGCQVPITGTDTIVVKGVLAHFNFSPTPLCDSGLIAFTDSSTGNENIVSYNWKFGDGLSSILQNPVHNYSNPGTYYPKLTVITASGCIDSAIAVLPVRIVASPKADFNNSGNGCAPLTVNFNGVLQVPDSSAISWLWDLGNGQTSNLQSPPAEIYTAAGIYPIRLIAMNSTGCRDTVIKNIEAYLVPTVEAGPDTLICRGTGKTVTASGADLYNWSPANGLSCTDCASPIANPDSLTRYLVKGTTLHGCSNIDSIVVNVKQRFLMQNSLGDTLCKGGQVRLFARGAFSYDWSPSAGLSNTFSPSPVASPTTTTTYCVIGTDDKGCFKDTGFITVKVYPIPTVKAGPDKTINAGQTVDLIPTISPDVTAVFWMPASGIVRNNNPGITVKPAETTNYTIEVSNPGGCKANDHVTVFVVCNGANVFIPNTFSPNADGVNDIFYPRGSGLFRIKSMRIFNRWGELVFEKAGFMPNDASAGWNGTYMGRKLTPDVFVYTIEIICDNNNTLTFKGNIALIL